MQKISYQVAYPLFALFFAFFILTDASAYNQHRVFFQNTDNELNVYRIYGEKPGKTLLILGGIQGNEPGGYLAADMYVELSLKKGNLIVVPRANLHSILRNVRGVNGDMNRKFADVDSKDRDKAIIEILKGLIEESDFLLNLHDGSGFYSDTWQSDLRNPRRYGQSIIADCKEFYSKKYNTKFNLEEIANQVCSKVNLSIDNNKHHFLFNNHQTFSSDTKHAEQRKSATYFAVTQHEIPAFGIETSKSLPSAQQRVRYQTMVINAFMESFGIIQEHPRIALPDPEMNFLLAAVNDRHPIVVYNGGNLSIERGDRVTILHAETNYERGITANILGVGGYNDQRKKMTINKETSIIVKKDNLKCGLITISLDAASTNRSHTETVVKYLILQVNEDRLAMMPGDHQKVFRGDILLIHDLITVPAGNRTMKVNFKGFVGNSRNNDGEDRGYKINTARNLIKRYSVNGRGVTYPIVVTLGGKTVEKFHIDIMDP